MKRGILVGVLSLAGLLTTACGAPLATSEENAADDSALVTSERVQLFAKDDATRIACRDVTNRTFCSTADATAKASACTGGGAATAAHLSTEVSQAACSKSAEIYPTIASCKSPLARHCGFYSACLERALPCGEDGYALGFGERFCTASRNAKLTAKGLSWTTGVMGCLERALVPRVVQAGAFASQPESRAVCSALFEEAFASHPACYTHPDHSICFLPPSDLVGILKIIGADELFTKRTSAQIARTLGVCSGQISREIGRRLLGAKARADAPSELTELRERASLLEELARTYEAREER